MVSTCRTATVNKQKISAALVPVNYSWQQKQQRQQQQWSPASRKSQMSRLLPRQLERYSDWFVWNAEDSAYTKGKHAKSLSSPATQSRGQRKDACLRQWMHHFNWISLGHSLFVIVFGTCLLLHQMCVDGMIEMLSAPAKPLQAMIFWISAVYHAADCAATLRRPNLRWSEKRKRLTRHIVCVFELARGSWVGTDASLRLIFFVLLELPNPPFLLALCLRQNLLRFPTVLRRFAKPNSCLDLPQVHLATFVASRLVAIQYTAHVLVPCAASDTTSWCAFVLLFLSALSLFDYVWSLGAQKTWRSKELRHLF